jgi:AsmA protein
LQGHALVANNVLTINPFTGELPGGDFTASATLDTSKTPAAETLAIKAPALALAPLFQAFGLGNTAEGNFQLQLNASSTGNDVQDIAAHINAQLGLASVNDVVDTGLIDRAFGPVEMAAGLKLPAASGMTQIRCFALAVAARNGVAAVNTAALDSSRLVLQGSGSVDLAQGAYKLSLLPVGGNQLLLGGSFAQPLLAAVGPAPPTPPAQTQAPDDCPAALAAARFGQPGPPAPPQATLTPVQTSTPPNAPKNLLNSLLTP